MSLLSASTIENSSLNVEETATEAASAANDFQFSDNNGTRNHQASDSPDSTESRVKEENGHVLLETAKHGNHELLQDLLVSNREEGDKDKQLQEDLIDFRGYLNFADPQSGYTALHYAAGLTDHTCVKILLMAGAEVNVFANPNGGGNCKTPLHVSAEAGNVKICKLLVDAGADVFASNQDGYSSLEVAQINEHQNVAYVLLDAIEKRQEKINDLKTRLDNACISGDIDVVEQILAGAGKTFLPLIINGHREDYSPLCRASERGNVELARLLIQNGADGRSHPFTLYSPLYIAVQRGYIELARLLLEHFPELVQSVTFEKWLPIHAVAQTGDVECARLLVDYPSYPKSCFQTFNESSSSVVTSSDFEYTLPFDINAQDVMCQTPLFVACASKQTKMIEFLLNFTVFAHRPGSSKSRQQSADDDSHMADIYEEVIHAVSDTEMDQRNADDEDHSNTMTSSIRDDATMVEPSTPDNEYGALKRSKSKLNACPGDMNRLVRTKIIKPVALDVYSTKGCTCLHAAISKNNKEIAKMLIEAGADVNLPLALSDDDVQKLLLQQPPQQQNEEIQICGSGALIEACKLADLEFVEYLLEKGAVDHENKALAVCCANNYDDLACKLLSKHVFNDPEFRINKKNVDVDHTIHSTSKGSRAMVVPSLLYPSCPVMLNWHSANMRQLMDQWLIEGALQLNQKLVGSSAQSNVILAAITRIDLTKNKLTQLPSTLFQLTSLRILNVSHNQIEHLPLDKAWNAPVLEEIHLDHNKLEHLPPLLFELPNLQGLDVSNNRLSFLPQNVWLCTKLKDLNVSYNRLKALPNFTDSITLCAPPGSRRTISLNDDDNNPNSAATSHISPISGGGHSTCATNTTNTTGTTDDVADDFGSVDSFRIARCEDVLSYQELKRHNLWQKTLELSKLQDDDELLFTANSNSAATSNGLRSGKSCLTSLNLCHNEFERAPEFLPCLAPALSRLNLSQNRLTEIGPVNAYPPRLKHLDLSNNQIKTWFYPPNGGICGVCGINGTAAAPPGSPAYSAMRPSSPLPGRRSHSVARGNRSISITPTGRGYSAESFCAHRRHSRLENLRTLVVAGNLLDQLVLTVVHSSQPPAGSSGSGSSRESSAMSNKRRSSAGHNNAKSGEKPTTNPVVKSDIVFPHLSMFDASCNHLRGIPSEIAEIATLSVLNLSQNSHISTLPPEMGLLNRLWNLNVTGCNLGEPLKSMLDCKRYKTMDIVGYLKSILEDSRTYARLKLMIVGVQGIGKTTLLEQLRQEGTGSYKKQPSESWAKRMGNKNINQKTNRGVNISTVGVDLNDWTYEPKRWKQVNHGPVTFRTWDFGGQREYYATHQYFLSKRSLYLVVWRVTDGEAGVSEITQWLVNIQARAPNSPVIIVGTHYDEVVNNSKKFPTTYVEDLQRLIRDKFVAVQDADKKGLPRVVDSVIISCKTRFNVRVLCDLIYHTAVELRTPGSKERLLEQKIPASYLALEEIVIHLANERKQHQQDPVLTAAQYKSQVQEFMKTKFSKQFRDGSELNQATSFLHENGVLLHYDDATLKDLYFLDPQWLCDILAHVITIREINPFAKNGLMKTDDLKILFKSSKFSPSNIRFYILNLIQKFEVALTWDNRTLLIPSLLPDEYQLRGGYPDCEVKIPVRCRGWIVRSSKSYKSSYHPKSALYSRNSTITEDLSSPPQKLPCSAAAEISLDESVMTSSTATTQFVPLFTLNRPKKSVEELNAEFYVNFSAKDDACLRRLYVMAYVPSGFWSRLITRLLGDEILPNIFDEYFRFITELNLSDDPKLTSILESNKPEWLLWQTGLEVKFLNHMLFSLKEFLPLAEIRDYNYKEIKFKCRSESALIGVDTDHASILEIVVPSLVLNLRYQGSDGKAKLVTLESDLQPMTRLLAMVVETVDTLLEDWYPSLGTRFVHTSEGKYLISRLVPCPYCLLLHGKQTTCSSTTSSVNLKNVWAIFSLSPKSGTSTYGGSGGGTNSTFLSYSASAQTAGGQAPEMTTGQSGVTFDPATSQGQNHQNLVKSDGRVIKSKTYDSSFMSPDQQYQRRLSTSSQDSGMNESGGDTEITCVRSISLGDIDGQKALLVKSVADFAYAFTIEELILAAYDSTLPSCSIHGPMTLSSIAPDIVFLDLNSNQLVVPEQVKRTKMLGRGAFGFVFKATVKFRGQNHATDVALKMLQPVDPGFSAKQSALCAYKAASSKWQRDPNQYACRAYCTARQELTVLLNLKHPNVVPLLGICTRPLALALGLAPCGSLNSLLQSYRRSGAYLNLTVLQETAGQVAKALEYLHQQHIIYRDLKADNVLVWQFPPAFSKLTNVEVKLGDYGISRSILPTGGAKGFGGTEGYMAPEIMRFNGEEEYTEKVDCFSFSMFLYELLTLKLPFEGHEQVKEYILDGGRPVLTTKELLYPSNIVDLMVVCWSQHPTDRPSSSQLVSITTAPEFAHLLDVVSLNSSDAAVVSGEAFTIDDGFISDDSSAPFDGEAWLSRADGLISILSCNQHGWLDYKNVVINEESFVTSLCLVEDAIWMGELTGLLRIFCVKTYSEIASCSLAPYVLPNDQSPKHQYSLQIVEMINLPALRSVLICINQPGSLLLCKTADVLAGKPQIVTATAKTVQGQICSCAIVLISDLTYGIWCGHSAGYLSVFTLRSDSFAHSAVVNHYNPVVEGVEVSRLVSSPNNGRYVWSYVYPGCILYQWDVNERVIVSKLDCSKIAPCSESINTLNIEERLSPGRCQVTALSLVEKEDSSQLYVGTTWGVLIVTEADQLKPITALRPHVDEIRVIIPVSQQKRATVAPVHHNRPSSTSVRSRASAESHHAPTGHSQNNAGSRPCSNLAKGQDGTGGQSSKFLSKSGSVNNESPYVITIGKGYRGLIQRFLDTQKEEQSVLESRQKDFFAILWRTDDWFNG